MSIDERNKKREERRESKEKHLQEKKLHRAEVKERREERREQRRAHLKSKPRSGGFVKMFLSFLLHLFHKIIDFVVELTLSSYLGPRRVCPGLSADQKILTKSAVDLARMIRTKEVSAYEVCEAYINRIRNINIVLNAVVDGPFIEALEKAKDIDTRIANGQISEDEFSEKPFLGVPFTTKDSTSVEDKLNTYGLFARRHYRAKEDAECVRLMKEAGAIIIATSNVPEVNKWVETRNTLFGQTNNPYDTRRSVGGSSGGEGALISSCCAAFGLGTDIGGSIRIPAYACGIFGHKSTALLVNMRGCTGRTGKETATMVTAGPMTRYAKDLLPIFKILVGPKNATMLKLDEPTDLKNLKYYYIPDNKMALCNPVTKEIQQTMFKVCEHFGDLTGSKVILADLPGLEMSAKMWRYWMTQEPADFNNLLGNGATLNPLVELAKKLTGHSDYTMAAIYSLIDSILPKENANKIREITRKCDESLTNLLGEDGILFYPSSPRSTPFHYYSLLKFNDFHYFSIFNVLKVPSTQVPLGLDSNGIPLGIQVVATRNRDSHCLAVAEELERAFGGWVRPFQMSQ